MGFVMRQFWEDLGFVCGVVLVIAAPPLLVVLGVMVLLKLSGH